jgi:hypothetical protein
MVKVLETTLQKTIWEINAKVSKGSLLVFYIIII